jgi:hypothetical protein
MNEGPLRRETETLPSFPRKRESLFAEGAAVNKRRVPQTEIPAFAGMTMGLRGLTMGLRE